MEHPDVPFVAEKLIQSIRNAVDYAGAVYDYGHTYHPVLNYPSHHADEGDVR